VDHRAGGTRDIRLRGIRSGYVAPSSGARTGCSALLLPFRHPRTKNWRASEPSQPALQHAGLDRFAKPCARRCARCTGRALACGSCQGAAGLSAKCPVASIPPGWPTGTRGGRMPRRSERVTVSGGGRGSRRARVCLKFARRAHSSAPGRTYLMGRPGGRPRPAPPRRSSW